MDGEEPREKADGELSANCIYHCYFKDALGIVPSTHNSLTFLNDPAGPRPCFP